MRFTNALNGDQLSQALGAVAAGGLQPLSPVLSEALGIDVNAQGNGGFRSGPVHQVFLTSRA